MHRPYVGPDVGFLVDSGVRVLEFLRLHSASLATLASEITRGRLGCVCGRVARLDGGGQHTPRTRNPFESNFRMLRPLALLSVATSASAFVATPMIRGPLLQAYRSPPIYAQLDQEIERQLVEVRQRLANLQSIREDCDPEWYAIKEKELMDLSSHLANRANASPPPAMGASTTTATMSPEEAAKAAWLAKASAGPSWGKTRDPESSSGMNGAAAPPMTGAPQPPMGAMGTKNAIEIAKESVATALEKVKEALEKLRGGSSAPTMTAPRPPGAAVLDECEVEEEDNPLKQIKALGVPGAVSYALWELGFWTLSVPIGLIGFFGFGEWQ